MSALSDREEGTVSEGLRILARIIAGIVLAEYCLATNDQEPSNIRDISKSYVGSEAMDPTLARSTPVTQFKEETDASVHLQTMP